MLSRLALDDKKPRDPDLSAPCALWPVDLKLTHVDCNPEATLVHFQGQYLTTCELDYNILQVEIQYTQKTGRQVEVGEFCLVEDVLSNRWFRGRVQNKQTDIFDVFLIDHGNVLSVGGGHLTTGSDELFMLPPKIVCGFFANVLPLREGWDGMCEKYFSSLIGSNVKGYIQALLPHKVLIFEAPDVNKDLKRLGFGKHVDTDTFLLLVEMLTDVPRKQSNEPVPDLLIGKPSGQEFSFKPHSLQGFEDILSSCGPKLTAGKKVKVKVTAAVSPGTFFLQMTSVAKDLQVMSEKLTLLCESKSKDSGRKSVENLGLLCSVRGKDDKWHRAFVQLLPVNSHVRVLFVDYGFCESVKVENMLQLPPGFLSKPIMAFPCALSCLAEEDEAVKTQQLSLLKKGMLGEALDARIDSFNAEHNLHSVTLFCAEEDTVALVESSQDDTESKKSSDLESELTSPQNGHLYYESALIQVMADSVQAEELKEDSVFEGYVEYVLNPSQFWLRTQKRDGDFQEMMNSMAEHFSQIQLDEEILEDPEPGAFCCAMYEKDMHYYRAIVTDTLEHGAEVYFIDFGNSEKIPDMLLKKIPQKFASEPAFALSCCLVNVLPVDDDFWMIAATDYFRRAASNKPLLVKVVHIQRTRFVVDLYEMENQNDKSISEHLTSANHAIYWKHTPSEPAVPEKRNRKPNFSEKKPLCTSTGPASARAENQVTVSTDDWEVCEENTEAAKTKAAKDEAPAIVFKPQRFKPGSELTVRCSHVNSPSDFWCQLQSKIPILDRLMDDLQQYYQTNTCPMQTGDSCCVTKFPGDLRWYRACIIGAQKDYLEMILVDYGMTVRAKVHNLQAITPEYSELEGQAFRCRLHNLIEPDLNCEKWSTEACDLLKGFVRDQSANLTCNIISHMYVKNNGLCCAADLRNGQHSAAEKLLERGLAREMQTPVQLGPSVCPESFVYSSFNLTSSSEERVYITHVCSPWELFCQLDSNTDAIEDLMDKVSKESTKMVNNDTGAVVGKLCLAKYSDGIWYRGVVQPVPPTALHLNIFFVDYGNTHIVEKSNVMSIPRESADLLFTPMQALGCCLAHIPKEENFAEVHQWLEKSILNIPLRAVVVGKTQEGTVLIDLFDGDIHINDKVKELIASSLPPKPEVVSPDTDGARKTKDGKQTKTPTKRATGRKDQHQRRQPSKSPKSTVGNQKISKKSVGNASVKSVESTGGDQDGANSPSKQPMSTPRKLSNLPDNNITAGFRGLGFVSHVDKASSFFVQMQADEPSILKIGEDLNSELLTDVMKNNATVELKVHDLVVAEYAEDGALYRAVVKDVESSGQYRVEFVDYGNTAVVGKEKTYFPTSTCLSQPRLSIPCSLVDTGSYDSDVTFTDAVMGKPLMVEFVSRFGARWEVNIQIQGQEASPAPAMLPDAECSIVDENKWDCASSPSPVFIFTGKDEKETSVDSAKCFSLPSGTSLEPSVKPKEYAVIPPQKIRAGQTENGKLLSILENGDLYVRVNRSSEELAELENLISEKLSKCQAAAEEDVKEGLQCLSRSSEDHQWRRAVVRSVSTDQRRCRVFLVDHGSTEETPLGGIRTLCDGLRQIPKQAVLCKWTGSGASMGEETYELWKETLRPLLGKDIKLMFVSYSGADDLWKVEIMMNELLLIHQMKPASQRHAEEETPVSTRIGRGTASAKDSTPDSGPAQKMFLAPVKMDQAYSGFVAAVTTPCEFYIVLLEDLTLTILSAELDDIPDELPSLPEAHLTPGACCLVRCAAKNKWCRAEVVHADPTAVVVINLVDYGHVVEVPYQHHSDLRRLPEQLTRLPKSTYPCVLRGVEPAGGGQWTDEAIVFFQECICQRDLQVLFRQRVSEERWEVDLVADGVHVASELVAASHASYVDHMLRLRFQEFSVDGPPCETPNRLGGGAADGAGCVSGTEGAYLGPQSYTASETLEGDLDTARAERLSSATPAPCSLM